MKTKQFNHLINHEAGLARNFRNKCRYTRSVTERRADPRAAEAVALFCYQIRKCIGSFTTVLSGLDVLVFSGGIGEKAPIIRSRICEGLDFFGIGLDEEQNRKNSYKISDVDGKVLVKVIHSDEETIIAKNVPKSILKMAMMKKQYHTDLAKGKKVRGLPSEEILGNPTYGMGKWNIVISSFGLAYEISAS